MAHTTSLQNHSVANDIAVSALKDMVKERGEICASIIVPTHRLGREWQSDRMEIQRALMIAKMALQSKSVNFLSEIDSLFQQIGFDRKREGVGIFISPHVKKLVNFPFPVTKKIVIDRYFHLRDLIYMENYRRLYYVLDISKKEVHLFRGTMDYLEEINDENFPRKIMDDYEYNKPSHSNSGSGYAHVKDVEKDKSILNQLRLKKIYRVTDKSLSKYLATKDIPLLVCGPTKGVSTYKAVTSHRENIVASLSDNDKGTSFHDLGVLAWLQIRSFVDDQKLKLVSEIKAKLGEGLAVRGIEEIWTASNEGRGRVLLVEKDIEKMAFVTKDNLLSLQNPRGKKARQCDVVDEIVSTVLEKNGEVVVVETGVLKDYDNIALIMRY